MDREFGEVAKATHTLENGNSGKLMDMGFILGLMVNHFNDEFVGSQENEKTI